MHQLLQSRNVSNALVRAAIVSVLIGIIPLSSARAGQSGCPVECPPGFFCQTPPGHCGEAGTCVQMPQFCPLVFNPVCGCDGVTYSNSCFAAAAGMSVAHVGACGKPNPCSISGQCPQGTYCQKAPGDCDGIGTCAPIPKICPAIFDPVCGCDGQTYSNSCFAAAAGVNVAHAGPCAPDADLNDDGAVDGLDIGIMLSVWGPCPVCLIGPCPCLGDLNQDTIVDGLDIGVLLSQWTM